MKTCEHCGERIASRRTICVYCKKNVKKNISNGNNHDNSLTIYIYKIKCKNCDFDYKYSTSSNSIGFYGNTPVKKEEAVKFSSFKNALETNKDLVSVLSMCSNCKSENYISDKNIVKLNYTKFRKKSK